MTATTTDMNLSIVVLGTFNPPIFQPWWLAATGLIGEQEAKVAKIEITHSEISIFDLEWMRCEVTRNRFSVRTSQESHYRPLRDLTVGMFRTLSHTPIAACGLNHTEILRLEDRDRFDQFGWGLVPREPWESVLERPGMAQLLEQGMRPDNREGFVRVKVEPFLDETFRVLAEINDHFVLAESPEPAAIDLLTTLLLEDWTAVERRAHGILARLKERMR